MSKCIYSTNKQILRDDHVDADVDINSIDGFWKQIKVQYQKEDCNQLNYSEQSYLSLSLSSQ